MDGTKIKVGSERKIAFDKKLRYNRQKDYRINNYELIPFEIDNSKKRVYKNFNLSIFVDDRCNADCQFCVAQLRYEHRGKLYQKDHIVNDEEYLHRLKDVLTIVRPLDPSISITGGEPTISPRLVEIIRIVNELGFRKRTITTNGSGLLNIVEGKTVLEHLIENGFAHLNISRVCVDEARNKEIMRYQNTETDYCSNEMLSKIAAIANGTSLKIRLSCILLKSAISDVKGIREYVDYYRQFGIDNFIFRQLMDYDHLAVNYDKMRYCDMNKIELNQIWESMEKDPEMIPYMNILGYYYYVEIYHYKDCTIASESADLEQQYIEKENNKDIVYEMVFHTDGTLSGSWVPTEEVLSKYSK